MNSLLHVGELAEEHCVGESTVVSGTVSGFRLLQKRNPTRAIHFLFNSQYNDLQVRQILPSTQRRIMVSTETKDVKKRRGTSLPLLIGLLILGVIGYYAGPTIMTYAFYLQESIIAGSGSNGGDLPAAVIPDTTGDPNIGAGPGADGPGAGGPGAGGPGAGPDSPPVDIADPPTDAGSADPAAK